MMQKLSNLHYSLSNQEAFSIWRKKVPRSVREKRQPSPAGPLHPCPAQATFRHCSESQRAVTPSRPEDP